MGTRINWLRCFLGLHRWTAWVWQYEPPNEHWIERKCLRCGKIQQANRLTVDS